MSRIIPECARCTSRRAGLIIIDDEYFCADCVQKMLTEARARAEAAEAEIERLREALRQIAEVAARPCVVEIARAALDEGGER
jgi:hypothetical protein